MCPLYLLLWNLGEIFYIEICLQVQFPGDATPCCPLVLLYEANSGNRRELKLKLYLRGKKKQKTTTKNFHLSPGIHFFRSYMA